MAKLRSFRNIDVIHSADIEIKEGEQYEVARKLFEENSDIMYFYYFDDNAVLNNRFYTYPIQRHSVETHFKYNS
jgi:hypothetical protein